MVHKLVVRLRAELSQAPTYSVCSRLERLLNRDKPLPTRSMLVSEESRNSGNSTFPWMLREAGATDYLLSTSPSHHTWM